MKLTCQARPPLKVSSWVIPSDLLCDYLQWIAHEVGNDFSSSRAALTWLGSQALRGDGHLSECMIFGVRRKRRVPVQVAAVHFHSMHVAVHFCTESDFSERIEGATQRFFDESIYALQNKGGVTGSSDYRDLEWREAA